MYYFLEGTPAPSIGHKDRISSTINGIQHTQQLWMEEILKFPCLSIITSMILKIYYQILEIITPSLNHCISRTLLRQMTFSYLASLYTFQNDVLPTMIVKFTQLRFPYNILKYGRKIFVQTLCFRGVTNSSQYVSQFLDEKLCLPYILQKNLHLKRYQALHY